MLITALDTERDVHLLLDLGEATQISEDVTFRVSPLEGITRSKPFFLRSRSNRWCLVCKPRILCFQLTFVTVANCESIVEELSQLEMDELTPQVRQLINCLHSNRYLQTIPEALPLEDMYPEQAPLGNTQAVEDGWSEEEEEEEQEETGDKCKNPWPDSSDDIVRVPQDALSDIEDDDDKPEDATGEAVVLSNQDKPSSDNVSFTLFHPPQQELLCESMPTPEGSLTFTNTFDRRDDVTLPQAVVC